MRWRRLARGSALEGDEERQRVVQHVCRNGQDQPGDRREDANPLAPGLNCKPEGRAKDASKQGVPTEPQERVAAAELKAIWRHSVLRVALCHVQRRLKPVEPESDERAVNDAVAHIVELSAQQPEEQQYSERLGELFGNRCGDWGRQYHRRIRPQHLPENRMLRNPCIDKHEEGGVERQSEPCSNKSSPEESCSEQPWALALAAVGKPHPGQRSAGE